ncbi:MULTISPECIES: hypothetical protein [unclassified Iodidimonas]|uniref:hypothetical protein n=1 Tax=unclassified Iodidimonas TaxID=2626145 RepID=UPI002483008F|nr:MULTISPECIES: hypothetical protein [unclassified Iodidimonas]
MNTALLRLRYVLEGLDGSDQAMLVDLLERKADLILRAEEKADQSPASCPRLYGHDG